MPLDLSFPAERTAPPKGLEIRPRQVKAWIESLPLQQSLEGCRQLNAHLAALNRARFDLDDRIQILEIYRPFAAMLLEELEAIYGKSALPLGPRARDALALARDLAGGLAVGCKVAIAEKSSRLIAFGAKKQLPMLMLRAIEYLGAALRASYRSYTPPPPGVWYEIHQLYLQAERDEIEREVADPDSKATIFDAYAEALLLALTDPHRLVQGEIDRILPQLKAHRGHVTLGRARPGTPSTGHFLVPCDTDKPPTPAPYATDATGGPNWRLLDANPAVDKLRAKKQALESGHVSATTSRAMGREGLAVLAKLIVLWGDRPKRAHRRDPREASVAICLGLKAVGHFVAREAKSDPRLEAEALRQGITVPIPALFADEGAQPMPVFEWSIVNQSEGGMKVRRTAAVEQAVAVGELVGMKFEERPRWTVGVVRWITAFDEGGMEFGVQFLASAASMVWVQPAANASPQAKPGLLLAGEAQGDEALLTPPNTFADLREFEIDQEGLVSSVRATGLIEKTGRFELFEIARA